MKAQHTPGPWKPSFSGKICIGVQSGGFYGTMICNTILPEKDEDYEKEKVVIEANAALIAAAPDMLEALQSTLNAMRDLIRQLPNDESLADFRLDYCEIAEQKAIEAIKKSQL